MTNSSKQPLDTRFEQAVRLIKSGDKSQGRAMLVEVLKTDPKNDQAWLWMTTAVETTELRRECLQEALKINPHNQAARTALAKLTPHPDTGPGLAPQPAPPQQPVSVIKPVVGNWIVLFLLSLFFIVQIPLLRDAFGALAVANSDQLQAATAKVTEYQTGILKGKTTYELRYRFQTPGQAQWYTAAPTLFDQSNPWSLMTAESWQEAKQQGNQIQVLYRPEYPWFNRPLGELAIDPVGSLAIWGWVMLINLVSVWEIFVARRNRAQCQAVAAAGGICRMRYWQVKRILSRSS